MNAGFSFNLAVVSIVLVLLGVYTCFLPTPFVGKRSCRSGIKNKIAVWLALPAIPGFVFCFGHEHGGIDPN